MATLADSFLADLDDLSDSEDVPQEEAARGDAGGGEEGDGMQVDGLEALQHDDLDAVAKLQKSERYHSILKRVEEASAAGGGPAPASAPARQLSDEEEYRLIVDCNELVADIDSEVVVVHNFLRDKYRLKFPELESLVLHPIDYARVVRRIGNEMEVQLVDLEGLLPSATIMVVSVTASTTSGKPLSDENMARVSEACERALELDEAKRRVLGFVESRMGHIAPNLSAVVGCAVAAQLMGMAGGLEKLAATPACNVQVLGQKKRTLAGFSTVTQLPHTGFVFHSEAVQATPPALRMKACRLIAGKCTLAARMDATGSDPSGRTGRALLEEVRHKIDKWQEPPPARQPKPLPVPDAEVKKKRGGRRLRKMKERYAMTDSRKLANRMQFGVVEESTLGDGIGEGFGMLGQAGSGKLRLAQEKSKLKVPKKFKEKSYGSSGNTSGLSSSLAFTPVQGIELSNPQAQAQLGLGTQSTYFSAMGTFSRIKKTSG